MLVTLSALIVAATMPMLQSTGPSQAATPAPIRRSPLAITSRDSSRAVRLAHRVQGDFEHLRRRLLPRTPLGGAGGCDAVVGRYCYVQQVLPAAPDEAPEVVDRSPIGTSDVFSKWLSTMKLP